MGHRMPNPSDEQDDWATVLIAGLGGLLAGVAGVVAGVLAFGYFGSYGTGPVGFSTLFGWFLGVFTAKQLFRWRRPPAP